MLVLVSVLGLVGCREDVNKTCNAKNPQDLPWLRRIIDENQSNRHGAEITRYTYKGKSVFLVDLCKQCDDGLSNVYNCEGEVICRFGGIAGLNTCPDFSEPAAGEVIWSR